MWKSNAYTLFFMCIASAPYVSDIIIVSNLTRCGWLWWRRYSISIKQRIQIYRYLGVHNIYTHNVWVYNILYIQDNSKLTHAFRGAIKTEYYYYIIQNCINYIDYCESHIVYSPINAIYRILHHSYDGVLQSLATNT